MISINPEIRNFDPTGAPKVEDPSLHVVLPKEHVIDGLANQEALLFVDPTGFSDYRGMSRKVFGKLAVALLVGGIAEYSLGSSSAANAATLTPESQAPVAHSQQVEVITGKASLPAEVITYYPNGKGYRNPLGKFVRAHEKRTGEDVTGEIARYMRSWEQPPYSTDPDYGGCTADVMRERAKLISWRARQGYGEIFSAEDIMAIMAVVHQGDADLRTFAGKDWAEGQEKNISFLHHAIRYFVEQKKEMIGLDRGINAVWSHVIDESVMKITRSLSGPSNVILDLRAGNFKEAANVAGGFKIGNYFYRNLQYRYKIREEDLDDRGEFQGGNVPYKHAIISDSTRSRGFDDGSELDLESTVSHRIRGNIFSGSMLETLRLLLGYSPADWVAVYGRMPNQF